MKKLEIKYRTLRLCVTALKKIMNLKFRQATRKDLPEIVQMLADDFLGTRRERYENPLPESYIKAFEEINADKNNELIVVENEGEVIGTL